MSCEYKCTILPSNTTTCYCQDGFALDKTDNRTCVGKKLVFPFYYHYMLVALSDVSFNVGSNEKFKFNAASVEDSF